MTKTYQEQMEEVMNVWRENNEDKQMVGVNRYELEKLRARTIKHYCQLAYEITKAKGFYDTPRETGTVLALIHSEVSEALEADRKGDTEGFIEELADICIRVFTLCGEIGIDLDLAIRDKMEKNKNREYKHGGKAY